MPAKKYDLTAVMREVGELKPIDIPFAGRKFTVPPAALWPDAVYDNDIEGARMLLGPIQYAAWVATDVVVDGQTYKANSPMFYAELSKAMGGVTVPESDASTDS